MQIEQPQPPAVPWTSRDVWLGLIVLILAMVIFIFFQALALILSMELNPGLAVILTELLLLAPAWWFTMRKYDVGWKTLGLRGFKGAMIGLGCGLMMLSFIFNVVYGMFLSLFGMRAQADLVPVFDELSAPWLLLVGGAIIAPVVEEVFFRGFVFAGFRERYGWQKAAVISSALFALLHITPTSFIPIFILGYIFAYLYQQSDSIIPAISMHVLTNVLALGTAFLKANTN